MSFIKKLFDKKETPVAAEDNPLLYLKNKYIFICDEMAKIKNDVEALKKANKKEVTQPTKIIMPDWGKAAAIPKKVASKITLGGVIKQARRENGHTQKQMAKKSGLCAATVCAIEAGLKSMPTELTLNKISHYCGNSPKFLYEVAKKEYQRYEK